ncbi:MAG: nitrous oxide reductase accessory protein NosL [Chitinophagales bacterium]|nr:nitrous oxide reductase accessory protein NosL [Chitinophagales bacterium]
MRGLSLFLFVSVFFLLSACQPKPHAIHFDEEDCDYCKMTISDNRYGAELVTNKGRVYKFDDLHCIKGFMEENIVESKDIHSLWAIDFSIPEKLIEIKSSFFLHNDQIQSPMGSNIASFGVKDSLESYRSTSLGNEIQWEEFLNSK